MGELQCVSEVERDVQCSLDIERPPDQTGLERVAFEQLSDDERTAVVRASLVHDEDVRVIERGGTSLVLAGAQAVGIAAEGVRQHLHRDVPLESGIPCPVHLAHACAEQADDLA